MEKVEVGIGDDGMTADQEPASGEDPGLDGVPDGHQLRRVGAAVRGHPGVIPQSRKTHLEAHLGVHEAVKHLELGGRFEMGRPGVLESDEVIGRGVQVDIHQAGH
jgi:hypothetical protein